MAEIFDITSSRRDHTQIDLLNNENTWLKIQNCSVKPTENYHLTNKAYVDELYEIVIIGTPTTIEIKDVASKTVSGASVTKTVTKSYSSYSNTYTNLSSGHSKGITFSSNSTFTYGVTFLNTPTVTTSNGSYYKVSLVNTSYATIGIYDYHNSNQTGVTATGTPIYNCKESRPAGTVTAVGEINGTTTVNDTVTFTKSFGVAFKNIPTITNLVNCTVSEITTSSCVVTVPVSGTVTSGSSVVLEKEYSFVVNGNV